MNILNLCFFIFYVCSVNFIQKGESIGFKTNDRCLDKTNNEGIEQCKFCTAPKKTLPNADKRRRKCFRNGVHSIFFECEDGYNCDSDQNSTIMVNYVKILPPTRKTNDKPTTNWTCYFDITNGREKSGYRARLYASHDSGCSNSTTFTIGKSHLTYQYNVHANSGTISGKNRKC